MEQTSENTTVTPKEFTEDLQDVLDSKNNGSGSVGEVVSPFFFMGKRNRFAAFAVNSSTGVQYVLADGKKLRIGTAPAVLYRTNSATQFREAVARFQQKLKKVVNKNDFT